MEIIQPCPELSPFVELYHILEWQKNSPDVYLPAWTNNFLFFKYGDNSDVQLQNGTHLKGYDTMVTGCMTYALRFVDKDISAAQIAVLFKPLTLYHFLKRDITFLTNQSFYGGIIFPGASAVMDAVRNVDNTETRIQLIERFLCQCFKNLNYEENPGISRFISDMEDSLRNYKTFKIQSFTDEIGINNRTFRRHFQKMIGMSPKLFYRIKRLEFVLRELHNTPDRKYLEFLRGYVDQAHFIKDFVRFTGHQPKRLQDFFKDHKLRNIYNYL